MSTFRESSPREFAPDAPPLSSGVPDPIVDAQTNSYAANLGAVTFLAHMGRLLPAPSSPHYAVDATLAPA